MYFSRNQVNLFKTYQITMKFIKFLLLSLIAISITSCGIYRPTDARKVSPDPKKRVEKNLEEGRGFRLLDTNRTFGTNFEFASSNELWRATLDTIDFMPLTTANYSGGIIVTDWYSDNQNLNETLKITVRFLTNEIRSDALDLKIFYKNCDNLNRCTVTEKNGELITELKKEILKKATIYKEESKENKKE
jgi:predicted small lipoprotein YifL